MFLHNSKPENKNLILKNFFVIFGQTYDGVSLPGEVDLVETESSWKLRVEENGVKLSLARNMLSWTIKCKILNLQICHLEQNISLNCEN